MVTRASPDPGETQAGLAGLEILAGQGPPDLAGREETLAVPGPEDSRECGELRARMELRGETARTGYREYSVSLALRGREETEASPARGELWVSRGLLD